MLETEDDLAPPYLQSEIRALQPIFKTLFGYHLLYIGDPFYFPACSSSPIQHKIQLLAPQPKRPAGSLVAKLGALPFANDSVDVVYLAHSLSLFTDPQAVLAELFRVLIPEGYLIITGLNPCSLWGLYRLFKCSLPIPPEPHVKWLFQVKRSLTIVGMEVVGQNTFCFECPQQSTSNSVWINRIGRSIFPAFGGGYVLLARKRVHTLTPIKPTWLAKRDLLKAGSLAEPTT